VILVDTSIWIDHFRVGDDTLTELLDEVRVLTHPFVIGEIAMGNLRQRNTVLAGLQQLPRATVAADSEVMSFIGRHALAGRGIGYIDAHLLAATRLTPQAALWTRDQRLHLIAEELAIAARPVGDG
jgi:predicted nucleic acid-binding protein